MKYCIAPMEGITYPEYRAVHSSLFPGAEAYYAPFVAPGSGGFKRGYLEKRLPDLTSGVNIIPQIMANDPEKFLEAATILRDMGSREINLNAGCPSGTVFSKHKGSGMLTDLSSLDSFLSAVYSSADYPVSIKTRMGVSSTEEFEKILPIYEKYPVACLTVHARARNGFYKSPADTEAFSKLCAAAKLKLCYNGDIFSPKDYDALQKLSPVTECVMLARGIIANPALGRMLKGGPPLNITELEDFHNLLLESYLSSDLGEKTACERMKELWFYMISLFPNCEKEYKAILKSRSIADYREAVGRFINSGSFDGTASFKGTCRE